MPAIVLIDAETKEVWCNLSINVEGELKNNEFILNHDLDYEDYREVIDFLVDDAVTPRFVQYGFVTSLKFTFKEDVIAKLKA